MQAVAGEARVLTDQAAVGPPIHDFRQLFELAGTWNPAHASEWRAANADMAYTVNAKIRLADGNLANALFRGSLLGSTPQPEFLVFHGEAGSLVMRGEQAAEDRIQRRMVGQQDWQEVPIADAITAGLPRAVDPLQRCWNQFFREFVTDVKDGGYGGYPTFYDGCIAAAVIDAARQGYDWKVLNPAK